MITPLLCRAIAVLITDFRSLSLIPQSTYVCVQRTDVHSSENTKNYHHLILLFLGRDSYLSIIEVDLNNSGGEKL